MVPVRTEKATQQKTPRKLQQKVNLTSKNLQDNYEDKVKGRHPKLLLIHKHLYPWTSCLHTYTTPSTKCWPTDAAVTQYWGARDKKKGQISLKVGVSVNIATASVLQ